MRPPQLRISLDELVVDSFAGGGGASTGIEAALGRPVDIAINHDPEAIEMHRRNHSQTKHLLEDVWRIDPVEACQGRLVGLAWFSPNCQHFSRAKGSKPLESRIRGLAWVAVRWANAVRPRIIMLENVTEFAEWCPLVNGKPDPRRLGKTFRAWTAKLKALGYQVETRELVAADFGAPTTRRRLFVIARCDGEAIVWPTPTHGQGRLFGRPWRTAREIIDWTLPVQSVTGRSRVLAKATRARIEEGLRRYQGQSHLTKYYGTGGQWQSLDEPLHTVTTKARFGLVQVDGAEVGLRMLQPRELFNAQGFPGDYLIDGLTKTAQISLAGNSVCPQVAQAIVEANCIEQRKAGAA